ncbi:NOX5 oxidase, partial [Lanius ludovicianus]|nr:NOX5 oxidase [Lanius ludovicianus]
GAMGAAVDAEWLRWVTKQFGNIAGKNREISLEEFKSALQVKESFFAERFFALFDSDGSGSLSLEELLGSLRLLLQGNPTEKLRFLFRVYDVDGSGSIDAEELRVVLQECLRESSMALPEERLGALSQALLQAADRDHSGSITFPELREQLEAFPEILENLSISAASWLRPPVPTERRLWPRCFSREFWRERLCCFPRELRGARLCCLGAWAAVTALLMALGALRHRGRCPFRGCPKGRGSWVPPGPTWIPHTVHVGFLGFSSDGTQGMASHCQRDIGKGFLAGRVGRGWAGIPREAKAAPGSLECLRPGFPWAAFPNWDTQAAPTGKHPLAPALPVLIPIPTAQVFYWSHLSYISVWLLLLLHGPHFWKWFLIPGSLFFLEKVLGWAWRRAGDLRILEVNLLPSKVTHLVIQRPKSFRFQPGDYVFLNVPAIAAYEWHPFSISSAPEQPETLWLHIRALGQWTNKLYEYFQQLELCGLELNLPGKSWREQRSRHWQQGSGLGESRRSCSVKCYLDGPYGTPSRRIFTSEHAVLIGAGIGITPFASILQSIMFRYRLRKQSCPSCHFSWCEERRDEEMTLRKVDFIWITRDQQHLQWFLSLLSKLETEQAELELGGKFLELHLYMTSALGKGDMKALGLQVALDLLAAKENRDSITGLRTRTQPGRPDWAKVFGKVAAEQRGKVRVFFCGSPGLAKLIRGHCRTFGFHFSKENF